MFGKKEDDKTATALVEQTSNIDEIMAKDAKDRVGQIDFANTGKVVEVPMNDPAAPKKTGAAAIIDEVHKQAVVATVQNSEDVRNRVLKQAEKSIDNELQSIDQENIKRLQATTYDANKDACSNYGINSDVPLWQIRLMKIGSSFWFIIYWIVATLIICPINVFCKGLKAFIKQSWLVVIVGVILYLLVTVGIPLIVAICNKYGVQIQGWFSPITTQPVVDQIVEDPEVIVEGLARFIA